MQPSQLEIQREVEALRDIRRRSTAQGGPGSLILDPDLPSEASQAQAAYWSPTDDSSSSSHDSHLDDSSVEAHDDPFHLFWVPAGVHPELAPKEFREFLKEHARSDGTSTPGPGRSNSVGSTSSGLGRKRSMLSRQYKPSANDGVGEQEEKVVPLRRNRSSYVNVVPQLTISDLQKLEELAEEASQSDDPTKLRSVLRRSLSLNIAPSVIDQMDDLRDPGDDVDAPIIVPPPGQVLRRTARTKIRKAGTGEGAHRFTATRRRKSVGRAATMEPRSSSDLSSSDHGETETIRRVPRSTEDVPEVPPLPRPESYSVESAIYDAYAQEEAEHVIEPPVISRSPDIVTELVPDSRPSVEEPELKPELSSSIVEPFIHQPQPQRALAPPSPADSPIPPRTPSPSTPDLTTSPSTSDSTHHARPPLPHTVSTHHPPSPTPSEHRREKDKKGLFGKWGSDKSSKKHKEKAEREKEKETGFFGSLFGSKKKAEESQPVSSGAAGRETAVALLGASKSSKNYVPPPSPQLGSYARYPIHVERAIYRLSHIKLANPRRPLYEQVLISNLMFWYLGVINKTGQNQGQGQGQNANAQGVAVVPLPDKEREEREERERAEKEREKQERKDGQRKGSLTKPAPNGSRRAETPVRGPQYEMQHRAMEQSYVAYGSSSNGSPPPVRTSLAPPPPMNLPHRSSPQQSQYSVQLVQPQPRQPTLPGSSTTQYFEIGESSPVTPQQYPLVVTGTPHLPPGAMPPVAVEQTWISQGQSSIAMSHGGSSPPPRQASPPTSPSSPGRRPRSPPQTNRYAPQQEKQGYGQPVGYRSPGRSLSATAAPSPAMAPVNGKVKKVMSAHAVPPRQASEDEDIPLAMWQQQQRRKDY
ncbi:hypothetical protein BD311DRAFT_658768 [Dichomitus squalens]|uniref:Protein Zds1 C-terminal domain-containing protein n=1 Tax=Dichomitus squalens TaxID=114155 RepID=A0A4Q9MSG1_9APHY|nr:hypothetical protein BD311DRAFT_658768 [Dichomitus squalens]